MEITMGNLITVGSIIGCWAIFVTSLKGEIKLLSLALSGVDRRLTAVETSIQILSTATVQVAKQEVRIEGLEDRIKDLEKG